MTILPTFLKKEPQMSDTRPAAAISQEAAKLIEGMNTTIRERDTLRVTLDDLRHDLSVAQREIDFLKAQIEESEYKRDFYQGLSRSLLTRLRVVQDTIRGAVQEAVGEAQKFGAKAGQEPVLSQEKLDELASTINEEKKSGT